MPLNDARIRALKSGDRPTKHGDGGGLLLIVNPNGSKLWRMVYRYGGKQKQLSFGAWPDVSLAQARAQRDEARKLLADDIDPSQKKKQDKIAKAEAAIEERLTLAHNAALDELKLAHATELEAMLQNFGKSAGETIAARMSEMESRIGEQSASAATRILGAFLSEELQKRYKDVGFLGAKFNEELATCYAGADVFVFPSMTDTFGLVVLEAMASGTPVAAYDATGPRDVIPGSDAGTITPAGGNLAEGAVACLSLSRATCRAYAETYSWRACAEAFIENLDPLPVPERKRFWQKIRLRRRKKKPPTDPLSG